MSEPSKSLHEEVQGAHALLHAPVLASEKSIRPGFYAVGNCVVYRSGYFLFGEEPVTEAPETVLLQAHEVIGNYGRILSASEVATILAEALNRERKLVPSMRCVSAS